jgi:hypothetical protein
MHDSQLFKKDNIACTSLFILKPLKLAKLILQCLENSTLGYKPFCIKMLPVKICMLVYMMPKDIIFGILIYNVLSHNAVFITDMFGRTVNNNVLP